MTCPLCLSSSHRHFYEDKRRSYLQCSECALVYVPPQFYLTPEAEKAEYDLHENTVDDPGYRQFLNRLWAPLSERLERGSLVLEFGCGPGPALADMMRSDGMNVALFDHFYFPDSSVLKPNHYHAITSTEVIEHVQHPNALLPKWHQWLIDGGTLALMTKLVMDVDAFSRWHYKNDPTHICFYSHETFEWLSEWLKMGYTQMDKDVAFFKKSS